jgi:hypothetical protein
LKLVLATKIIDRRFINTALSANCIDITTIDSKLPAKIIESDGASVELVDEVSVLPAAISPVANSHCAKRPRVSLHSPQHKPPAHSFDYSETIPQSDRHWDKHKPQTH